MIIFRLFLGSSMLLAHGLPKLKKYSQLATTFPDPLGVGSSISLALVIFAEVVCSIFIIIGFKLRYALIPLIITMLVAAFIIHFDDPYSKKEMALLYLFGYLTLFFNEQKKN